MTTANGEHHVKSIMHSHDHGYYDDQHGMDDSSSVENSPLRRVPKSMSSSFKRVSFGTSKGTVVETYVYESVPIVEEGRFGPHSSAQGQTLAHSSNSPPTKLKVTSSESEAPHTIPPPAALDISGASEGVSLTAHRPVQIISPPLPSSRKMEVENPFRPDGTLSHEVDPIVETYKHRPFPSGHRDSMDGSLPPPSANSSPAKTPAPKESSKNGTTKRGDVNFAMTNPMSESQSRNTSNAHQHEVQHKQIAPKTVNLELVHIESKKRKCGCCTIQ